MAERQAKRQDKKKDPAPAPKKAKDTAAQKSYQPVYVAPRRSRYESEARRAAASFGGAPIDFQPSALGGAGQKAQLGPDLSRKVVREVDKGGATLPSGTRNKMERHFHESLRDIRVVNNAVSDEVASSVDTHAFTVGNTIFFASGTYAPGDPRSDRILAHELTHALQYDRGGKQDYIIQRDDPTTEDPGTVWPGERGSRGYKIELTDNAALLTMPKLKLPKIDGNIKGMSEIKGLKSVWITEPFSYTTHEGARQTTQRATWLTYMSTRTAAMGSFLDGLPANSSDQNGTNAFYYLKVIASDQILIGTKQQLLARNEFAIPTWDKNGERAFFDVDHYREHQLKGRDHIDNMWLLESSANRSSGTRIKNTVLKEVNTVYKNARDDGFFDGRNAPRDVPKQSSTPRNQAINFLQVKAGHDFGNEPAYWTTADIVAARHLTHNGRDLVTPLTVAELEDHGLIRGGGDGPQTVLWFLGKEGSFYRHVDISDPANPKFNQARIARNNGDFIKNFQITSARVFPDFDMTNPVPDSPMGELVGEVRGGVGTYYDRDTNEKVTGDRVVVRTPITLPILYDPRFGYGGYIDRRGVRTQLMEQRATDVAEAKGTSPFAINDAGLTDDWAMGFSATLTSTHPMFAGLEATLGLTSYGIQLDVAIPTDRLDFGFFRVTEASLSVAYGDEGLLFGGSAGFEIPHIGTGAVTAMGEVIEGNFDFDFDFVDPASVSVRYENENWSFSAELGIIEGTIPGLNSGQIRIGIDEEGGLSFDGEASVQLPGQSEPVGIEISYTQEEGVTIGGTVDFNTDAWPMIENATVNVSANLDPETGEWTLGGTGQAAFAFPGVTGDLRATYQNGGIIFSGNGEVAIGNATGEFSFAVGNFPLNEEGEFDTSAEPTEEFDAWGSGSVSIAFGPYLTGTAGIAYTPEDEIVISGGIALPPSIELFEAQEYDRQLLRFPRLEFPIFGVTIPVVGSIGIFGFIGGSVRGFATVGPATLDDTHVDISYTLGDPDSAVIHGESHLNFGMEAGLELALSGGLGLGAAVADVTGEVGITAALVLNVDAGADLDVNWTPLTGLEIDMALRGSASPSFRVGVFGQVAASVALYGEVWSERWDRTLAEFGSGLEVGITQPASWDEENGLELDFANAEFTYPEFDIEEISSSIMDRIV